jgi:hypothetical protein
MIQAIFNGGGFIAVQVSSSLHHGKPEQSPSCPDTVAFEPSVHTVV